MEGRWTGKPESEGNHCFKPVTHVIWWLIKQQPQPHFVFIHVFNLLHTTFVYFHPAITPKKLSVIFFWCFEWAPEAKHERDFTFVARDT